MGPKRGPRAGGSPPKENAVASKAPAANNLRRPTSVSSVEQVYAMFDVSLEELRQMKSLIGAEFELGLGDEEAAAVKMLITYVRELSRGDETGSYLALDLGGTNFRVLLVKMKHGSRTQVHSSQHKIPEELQTTPNGQELFDYIALRLLDFVQKYDLRRRRISLGFTFSFPCKQYGLTQSILVKWNKGFKVGGVVGTDVVRQLKDALKRQLSGLCEAYIDVVAVINDTTGTLVACASQHPECRIGLIVGTGFNACYIERLERCEKWPANYTHPKQVIINCEWGAMGDRSGSLNHLRNEFDFEIDAQSVNPANQTYEKMVAGMYIGELLRLAMLKLHTNKLLFVDWPARGARGAAPAGSDVKQRQAKTTPDNCEPRSTSQQRRLSNRQAASSSGGGGAAAESKLRQRNVLDGRHLSLLAEDELAGRQDNAAKIVQSLGIDQFTERDLAIVIKLASKIIRRSAHLAAAGISALLERIQRPYTVVGADGSVIKMHPYFKAELTDWCQQLTNKEFRFDFALSSDGSGIGAAVVAAALHKERRPLYVVKPGKLYEMHFAARSGPALVATPPLRPGKVAGHVGRGGGAATATDPPTATSNNANNNKNKQLPPTGRSSAPAGAAKPDGK